MHLPLLRWSLLAPVTTVAHFSWFTYNDKGDIQDGPSSSPVTYPLGGGTLPSPWSADNHFEISCTVVKTE